MWIWAFSIFWTQHQKLAANSQPPHPFNCENGNLAFLDSVSKVGCQPNTPPPPPTCKMWIWALRIFGLGIKSWLPTLPPCKKCEFGLLAFLDSVFGLRLTPSPPPPRNGNFILGLEFEMGIFRGSVNVRTTLSPNWGHLVLCFFGPNVFFFFFQKLSLSSIFQTFCYFTPKF